MKFVLCAISIRKEKMILNKPKQEFTYEGQTFYIGQKIVATEASPYDGLFGTIWEIRDGEDKDTKNETPEIYCHFERPQMPCDIEQLEEKFSRLYGEEKSIDDICLDCVIMAPEMIEPRVCSEN